MTIEKARQVRSEKNGMLPRCSYLNKKGVQCSHRCPSYIQAEGSVPLCAQHINSSIYKRCLFVEYDNEGKAYECPCYHRTVKDYCGSHNAKIYNRLSAKEFYNKNKDILAEKRRAAKLANVEPLS